MSELADRLRASVRLNAVNGDVYEQNVCERQMTEAANALDSLGRELAEAREALPEPKSWAHLKVDGMPKSIEAGKTRASRRAKTAQVAA